MGRLVMIPQNYEHLSCSQRKEIIPICIRAFDQHGQPIAAEWFFNGVAPVRQELVSIAHYLMGDPWCASELAETAVHRLWAKYGSAVGPCPTRRVLKKAMWVGEELMAGDWRMLKYPNLYLALETMEGNIRDQVLADPRDYADLFEKQLLFDWVDDTLKQAGRKEMRIVWQLVRQGHSWEEIAAQVGASGADQVKRRFYRWRKKAFDRR